jgi:hypothetical protein
VVTGRSLCGSGGNGWGETDTENIRSDNRRPLNGYSPRAGFLLVPRLVFDISAPIIAHVAYRNDAPAARCSKRRWDDSRISLPVATYMDFMSGSQLIGQSIGFFS